MRQMVIIVCGILATVLVWLIGAFKAQADMDAHGTVSVDDPDLKDLEPDEAYLRYAKRRTRLSYFWPYYFLVVAKRRKIETRPS